MKKRVFIFSWKLITFFAGNYFTCLARTSCAASIFPIARLTVAESSQTFPLAIRTVSQVSSQLSMDLTLRQPTGQQSVQIVKKKCRVHLVTFPSQWNRVAGGWGCANSHIVLYTLTATCHEWMIVYLCWRQRWSELDMTFASVYFTANTASSQELKR